MVIVVGWGGGWIDPERGTEAPAADHVVQPAQALCEPLSPGFAVALASQPSSQLSYHAVGLLEREFLVLCSLCHRDVHEACLTVAEQKEILRYRPGDARREIRRILNYTPKPYVPPEPDISQIYEEAGRINTHIFGV